MDAMVQSLHRQQMQPPAGQLQFSEVEMVLWLPFSHELAGQSINHLQVGKRWISACWGRKSWHRFHVAEIVVF